MDVKIFRTVFDIFEDIMQYEGKMCANIQSCWMKSFNSLIQYKII